MDNTTPKRVQMQFPFPPSVNSLYQVARVGGRCVFYKTKEGKAYTKTIKSAVINYGEPRFGKARLAMVVHAYPPNCRAWDLGNLDKILSDSLEEAKVFDNDKQIDDMRYIRRQVHKPGAVVVTLQVIDVPHETQKGNQHA